MTYPKIRSQKANPRLYWAKVRKTDYCWFWTGETQIGGYGTHGGLLAHRVAWTLTRGEIPTDRERCFVLHKCDNRRCVNPQHLYLGSKLDNGRDTRVRKRYPNRKGEASSRAKLKTSDVLAIRQLCADGMAKTEIGRRFKISPTMVRSIEVRKAWAHV